MEKLFNRMTKVVHQNPSIPDELVARKYRSWVLLPTIAYKVLVPDEKESPLNLFQETILKLLLSGYKTSEYIADRLLLKVELVEYILQELVSQELLGSNGLVTDKGKALIDEQQEPHEMKIGYIFFDVSSQSFWDTFVLSKDLQYIISEFGEQYRQIELGKIDAPRKFRSVVVQSDLETLPPPPSSSEIINVLRRHKRRLRNRKNGHFVDEEVEQLVDVLPRFIEKVQFLEETFPLYVTTFMYMPSDVMNNSHWRVCYPFGKEPSPKLFDTLTILRDNQRHLKEEMSQLVQSALRTSEQDYNQAHTKEINEANDYLVSILGTKIETYNGPFYQLQQLFLKYKELKTATEKLNQGHAFDEIQSKISGYIIKSSHVIEETLSTVRSLYVKKQKSNPEALDPLRLLSKHKPKNAEMLTEIAKQLGFQDEQDENAQAFFRFLAVSYGEVKYVEQSRSLRPLLAYHLLVAKDDTDHPFMKMVARFPEFIVYMQQLTNRRNEFAHTTEKRYYLHTMDEILAYTMEVVSILLTLPFNVVNLKKVVIHDEKKVDMDTKTRLLSEQTVDIEIGSNIRSHSTLFKALTEVHLLHTRKSDQFILSCTSALEALLNECILRAEFTGAKSLLAQTGSKTLSRVVEKGLSQQGFKLNVEKLPTPFLQVNMKKVKLNVEQLKYAVLNVKVYALLVSAANLRQPLFEQIGAVEPDFFETIILLSDMRGHGSGTTLTEEEANDLLQRLFTLFKNVYPEIKLFEVK